MPKGDFKKMTEMSPSGGDPTSTPSKGAEDRTIHLNDELTNAGIRRTNKFAGNTVVTSKYSLLTFLPKNLFEFFRVVANVYFLVISALQVGTNLSPTNPYTTITPLIIVFFISMVKQGIEDCKRHAADRRMNATIATAVREGKRVQVQWKDIRAGDIVLVRDREEVPADIVVLVSSEDEGRCFTETSNLDGETNLKRRQALKATLDFCGRPGTAGRGVTLEQHLTKVCQLRGHVDYEPPNPHLYLFAGNLVLEGQEPTPITPTQVILRGCLVRSCKYVLGLVLYTGKDTKLVRNSSPPPFKQSAVYRMVNRYIILIFTMQFVLCLVSTISFGVFNAVETELGENLWYMGNIGTDVGLYEAFASFITFLILFNNLVPISLYVSLDVIKVIQAKFIERDMAMCLTDPESGETTFAKARTSDLNEDLGQIEYIFSDKTGTLTRNMMEFRKCSIGGVAYGFGTTEIGRAAAKRQTRRASDTKPLPGVLQPGQMRELSNPKRAQVIYNPKIHFDDPRLVQHLRAGGQRGALIHEFLTLLAVCHTVMRERSGARGEVSYRAASPDEEALVKAAKCLGYDFQTPAPVVTVVNTATPARGVSTYDILNINEFDSTRKRMSVVVKLNNKYILYCKGADSVMYKNSLMQADTDLLTEHLRMFASEGLRTLVLARRQVSVAEYQAWNMAYKRAAASTKNRAQMMAAVAAKIEVNMQIIGATAIEDKLQVGVPRAIADLATAGIKIWVLTGDKEETAINIGYACRLLTNEMKLIYINQEDPDSIRAQLNVLRRHPALSKFISAKKVSEQLALVVDGTALGKILINRHQVKRGDFSPEETQLRLKMTSQLLSIARCCKAVVACRVSPSQKAAIVKMVRKGVKPQPLTLAIGDGANDVNMIQTAHVGIGISGQEGVQAVNSSDYAIAQFRFLKPLLLVHGRLNYQRISKVILYSFYKNISLVMVLFFFNFYNGFSGTTLFESFVMAGWNFFLALPIMVIGVSDYDVNPYLSMRNPALYVSGQWKLDLNVWRFIIWIINALVHAVIVFFLPLPTMTGTWDSNGLSDGLYVHGTAIYSCLLLTMNYKVALETRVWTFWSHFFFWGSVASFFLFLTVYNMMAFGTPPFYWSSFVMFGRPTYWLLLLLVPFACISLDVIVMHCVRAFSPFPGMVLAERHKAGMDIDKVHVSVGGHDTTNPLNALQTHLSVDDESGLVDLSKASHTGYDFNTAVDESAFAHEDGESTNFIGRMKRSISQRRASTEARARRASSAAGGRGTGAGVGAGAGAGAGVGAGAGPRGSGRSRGSSRPSATAKSGRSRPPAKA